MEVIIFAGLQGSGKSTFYKQNFCDTHLRINLDMLKTRHREKLLLDACVQAKQPVVIDNTNLAIEYRARFITIFRAAGFQINGYYFSSTIEDCLRRNDMREGREKLPHMAIRGARNRLVLPSYQEGFDKLFFVRSLDKGYFDVQSFQEDNDEI